MKKEFVDYLYKLKSLVQADIDRLSGSLLMQRVCGYYDSKSIIHEKEAELRTRRSQLQSIDETIKVYFKIHSS
jgi:hypothetical protein